MNNMFEELDTPACLMALASIYVAWFHELSSFVYSSPLKLGILTLPFFLSTAQAAKREAHVVRSTLMVGCLSAAACECNTM